MNTRSPLKVLVLAFLCSIALGSGCAMNPVPDDGTRVESTGSSQVFLMAARDIRDQCASLGGCTCFMDGIQTRCSLAFACLDAGFCRLVAN